MFYKEYSPSGLLSLYIDCYWLHAQERIIQDYTKQSCLPLGTVELIIQVNERPSHHLLVSGEWIKSSRVFFAGFYEHPVVWKAMPDSVMFGIRLKPESLAYLFNTPVAMLLNVIEDAEAVAGAWIREMADEMCGVTEAIKLISIAQRYLFERIMGTENKENRFVHSCRLMRQQNCNFSIDSISENIGVGRRQLERLFKEQLGTTPKMYQRIIRFTKAYDYIHSSDRLDWADITYNYGYSDQSHFIRDFKEFTGFAPTDFIVKEQLYTPKSLSVNVTAGVVSD